LINVAVAEKVSALRTASYFAERAARANIPEALRILDRAGVGQPPSKATSNVMRCRRNARLREARVFDAFAARPPRSLGL
jgi:hypothetical protein